MTAEPVRLGAVYSHTGRLTVCRILACLPGGICHNAGLLDFPREQWPEIERKLRLICDSVERTIRMAEPNQAAAQRRQRPHQYVLKREKRIPYCPAITVLQKPPGKPA